MYWKAAHEQNAIYTIPHAMDINLYKGKIQTQKGSNERLFILTRTHSMQIFGEMPFVKPQNDT